MSAPVWSNVTIRLGDLTPWERNPKTISKKHAKRLLESWERLGQFQTIAIGLDGSVYDGHQRLSVLLAAHGKQYQVMALQSDRALTEAEREELVITAHVGTVGQFDWGALAGWDTTNLQSWGMDDELLKSLNSDAVNVREMLNSELPPVDPDDVMAGMPEFENDGIMNNAFTCTMRFLTEEDRGSFEEMLGYKLTHKGESYSAWYPQHDFDQLGSHAGLVYSES